MSGTVLVGCGAALGLVGLGLVGVGARTARLPDAPVPDRDGYFDRWSALHGGYDLRTGSVVARGWLSGILVLARPLAVRGVLPDVVTLTSAWVAAVAVLLAAVAADRGGGWAVAAALVVVLNGALDNLDGCLAVLTGRSSRWGYLLDSLVDRVSDAAFLLAVVLVGCPAPLAVGCGLAVFLLEYARSRAAAAGAGDVGVVTAAERPTRVIVLSPSIGFAALFGAPVIATVGTAVLLGMTLVALVQVVPALRRELLALPPS